jgi:hypothetical protein
MKDAFRQACNMEKPIERARNFTAALERLAPTLDDERAAGIVQELTSAIEESLDKLDDIHTFFFRHTHPDRAKFELEGWPDDDAPDGAVQS